MGSDTIIKNVTNQIDKLKSDILIYMFVGRRMIKKIAENSKSPTVKSFLELENKILELELQLKQTKFRVELLEKKYLDQPTKI